MSKPFSLAGTPMKRAMWTSSCSSLSSASPLLLIFRQPLAPVCPGPCRRRPGRSSNTPGAALDQRDAAEEMAVRVVLDLGQPRQRLRRVVLAGLRASRGSGCASRRPRASRRRHRGPRCPSRPLRLRADRTAPRDATHLVPGIAAVVLPDQALDASRARRWRPRGSARGGHRRRGPSAPPGRRARARRATRKSRRTRRSGCGNGFIHAASSCNELTSVTNAARRETFSRRRDRRMR